MNVQAIRGTIGELYTYTLEVADIPRVLENRQDALNNVNRARTRRDREGWHDWLVFWDAVLQSLQTSEGARKVIEAMPRNLSAEQFAETFADRMNAAGWNYTSELQGGKVYYPRAELVQMGRDIYAAGRHLNPGALRGKRVYEFDKTERKTRVGQFLEDTAQLVNQVNPVIVAARAAVLTLVSNNVGGIASKMQQKQPERMRKTWEDFGGTWSKLAEAIEKGSGKPPGVNALPALIVPALEVLADGGGAQDAANAPPGGKDGKGGSLGKLWNIARPIIEPLLRLLGIAPDTVKPKDTPAPGGAPNTGPGAPGVDESGTGLLVLLGIGAAVVALSGND